MKHLSRLFLVLFASTVLLSFTHLASGYEPGSMATDFRLLNTDGKYVRLADDKKAKGFIVIFTCNHCPYAQAYEDRIIALDNKYRPLGYPVVAINPNDSVAYPEDSRSQMVKRSKEKNYPFPYLLDAGQEVTRQYGAVKTPHVYLLRKSDKKLVVEYTGAIDNNWEDESKITRRYVEEAIEDLNAGREVKEKTTKAIGCGIKWKKK